MLPAVSVDLRQFGPSEFALVSAHVGPHRLVPAAAVRLLLPPLLKADSIPEGARWITVHPNGPGTKGTAVLVQEQEKGSGVWHVIAGAGGSLNYLKVRGVKSPEHYAQDAKDRAVASRAARKAQLDADKAAGLTTQKRQVAEALRAQVKEAESLFIQQVSSAMGWGPEVLGSSSGDPKADALRHKNLMQLAQRAVDTQRRALIDDSAMRQAALGAGVPVLSADAVSVADLMPGRPVVKTGIRAAYGAMAAAAGLDAAALAAEVKEIQSGGDFGESGAPETPSSAVPGSEKLGDESGLGDGEVVLADAVGAAHAPLPDLKPSIASAEKAMALLAARKKLAALRQQARAAGRELAGAQVVEPKAYVLAVGEAGPDVQKAVAQELATLTTRSFLQEASKAGAELVPHVADGAANALNAASLALAGVGALDRAAIDVLGASGAAQVLARRLRLELSPEAYDRAAAAVSDFHAGSHQSRAEAVLAQVKAAHDLAAQPLDTQVGPEGLAMAAAAHLARSQALADANAALGRTLGEFEARAALVAALGAPPVDSVRVSLGAAPLDSAVKQVRALGLVPGEYALERAGASVLLTVKGKGLEKLAAPVDHDTLERVAHNVALARGEQDEDGWLPQGFASRPDLALKLQPGAAPSLAVEFEPGEDLAASLRRYIGARAADGHAPGDIVADVQSAAFYAKAGASRSKEYRAALDAVAPNKIDGKRLQRAEQLAPLFESYADAFVAGLGGDRAPLHAQTFEADKVGQEAAHRALSAVPEGVAAFKAVGDLTPQDQAALRGWFARNVARESPEAAEHRAAYDAHLAAEPEKVVEDLFGEQSTNPDWSAWDSARGELASKVKAAGFSWPDYVKAMGSPSRALGAVQDLVRSHVSKGFADAYNTLRPGSLAVGRTVVRDNLRHLSAVDPAARAEREAKQKALIDSLRERVGGKYASGSVSDKIEAAAEQQAAFEQSQMGFWAAEPEAPAAKPLGADERHTLGHAAEQKLAALVGQVGGNFEPGKPVRLFHASMSGPDGAVRQRAIKHVVANRRSVLGLGVGSGKTGIGLGAFAHLHSNGQVKKGLFCVPSIVQGQFGAEALRFLEPGRFKWHCDPGGSYADRLAAYKDPGTHFAVVTHQGFRDDVLRMAAGQGHGTPEQVASKMHGMARADRRAFVASVLQAEGIQFDYLMADEAHGLLDRDGKEDSRLSEVVGAVADHAPYYVHASGDPVKNDASEAHSLLSKMDPDRYGDRGAFMRRYGGDTNAAAEGLRRELARHVYAASLKPDVQVTRSEKSVALRPEQHQALDALDQAAAKVRLARLTGKTDEAAARVVAPHLFDGLPADKVQAAVQQVHDSLPLLREAGVRRVIDEHPDGAKVHEVLAHAAARKGKPGVVFARSLAAVEVLRQKLEAAGHRVVTITGADSSDAKAEKIRAFNPEQGERKADVVLCSDAGAVGANLQSGQWLLQYDTPDTAMVHAQRQGRIDRIGQKNAIELTDLVADHAREHRARERLRTKYGLRDLVTSPLESLDDTGLAFYLKQQQAGQEQAGLF